MKGIFTRGIKSDTISCRAVALGINRGVGSSLGSWTLHANNHLANSNGYHWRLRLELRESRKIGWYKHHGMGLNRTPLKAADTMKRKRNRRGERSA